MRRSDAKRRVALLAARQFGLITRQQALALGMSSSAIDRLLRNGDWLRVFENVFRIAAAPITHHQRLLAPCLRSPGKVWVSHRAAASFWGLDGFEDDLIEVSTVSGMRGCQDLVVHRLAQIPPSDVCIVRKIPVTTVHRTLIDLGSVVPPDAVELALECALRRKITSIDRLHRRLTAGGTRGRRGPAVLTSILRHHSGRPTESALETRFVQFLRRFGLPMPDRQVAIRDESGFVGRVDFIYAGLRVVVEVDSRAHHQRRSAWEDDLRRRNRLTSEGYLVLHVTYERLTNDPNGIAAELRKDLAG
jgi:very-short-patch-repair endonuclease